MNWTNFNDNHNLIGIEGKYGFKNDTLVVFVEPTNSFEDWISDFIAFPVPLQLVNWKRGFVHAGYKSYAYWLTSMIYTLTADRPEITKLVLIGYSMGGGVVQITGLLCEDWIDRLMVRVVNIDGPRTTSKMPKNIKLLRNRGSLVADVPPWFKQAPKMILSCEKRPFWKAHADYDIGTLIDMEVSG